MNLRTVKKEIEYLVGSVIDDCDLYISLFDGKESANRAGEIANDAVELYNELIDKVNNPDKSSPAKTREHYRNIRKELDEGVDSLSERLSNIAGSAE